MIADYLDLYKTIMTKGCYVHPRGQDSREIEDLQLIVDPDKPFMTYKHRKYNVDYFKREMKWKLGANKYDTSIQAHAKMWAQVINPDGTYNSNYGQYWFGQQMGIWKVVMELMRDRDSRKAIIPMLNDSHLSPQTVDTVCTESIGFRIRNDLLNCSVHMRSSDAIYGLATDIPTFAFLYRLVKGLLGEYVFNGNIVLTLSSSHIYSRHYDMVQRIIEDPEYIDTEMPYCKTDDALRIIASRGDESILRQAGRLGNWLCNKE
jgi:thymidylate synthase